MTNTLYDGATAQLRYPIVREFLAIHNMFRCQSTLHNVVAVEPQAVDSDPRRLAEALRAHLAYEETHVCPLLTQFLRWPMFAD